MILKNVVFWDVTPCSSCKNRRFGGKYCRNNYGDKNRQARNNAKCSVAVRFVLRTCRHLLWLGTVVLFPEMIYISLSWPSYRYGLWNPPAFLFVGCWGLIMKLTACLNLVPKLRGVDTVLHSLIYHHGAVPEYNYDYSSSLYAFYLYM
jgi:hypothetical protein